MNKVEHYYSVPQMYLSLFTSREKVNKKLKLKIKSGSCTQEKKFKTNNLSEIMSDHSEEYNVFVLYKF